MTRFEIDPARSSLVVSARSSAGRIHWQCTGLRGSITASIEADGTIGPNPVAELDIDMTAMTSGNRVYDAELARRIDSRRHPRAQAVLEQVGERVDGAYPARGSLTFHGVVRPMAGELLVDVVGDALQVTGSHVIDMRDFDVPTPTILRLKILPDVQVSLFVVAERSTTEEG